jgi:hypothetical protein
LHKGLAARKCYSSRVTVKGAVLFNDGQNFFCRHILAAYLQSSRGAVLGAFKARSAKVSVDKMLFAEYMRVLRANSYANSATDALA